MTIRNRLIAALPALELERFGREFEEVPLPFKEVLYEPNGAIAHAYFPTRGVVSLVNEPKPGDIVEFGTVGYEGMVGLPLLLGDEAMPSRALVQVPGEALRISARAFRQAVESNPEFRMLLMRYTMALFNQIAQSASCNRLHEVQERCARWLLQTHDRADGDSFPLTQEFLAQMLGVHRPTVSVAAGMLQRAGLIRYVRGVVTVLDRRGLEAASCACYGIIAREYDRLLNARHG